MQNQIFSQPSQYYVASVDTSNNIVQFRGNWFTYGYLKEMEIKKFVYKTLYFTKQLVFEYKRFFKLFEELQNDNTLMYNI